MDSLTLQAYDRDAAKFAEAYREIAPKALWRLCEGFFHAQAPTVDVGCGSGRDVAWMVARGFLATGYDASQGMLRAAKEAYPGLDFRLATLPDLCGVEENQYDNLLCSGVLMHLPRQDLITAVLNIGRILKAGGRAVIAVRCGDAGAERGPDGRLFTPIEPGRLALLLESAGFEVVLRENQLDSTRPSVQWNVILATKSPLSVARGLDRIQSVLAQDRKTATYKLALVRALCAISRTEAQLVAWQNGQVLVPLWLVAVKWLRYYWPLLCADRFIAQIRGELPGSAMPVAFRGAVGKLAASHGRDGLWAVLGEIDRDATSHADVIGVIARTIKAGPIRYAGTMANPVFEFVSSARAGIGGTGVVGSLGWVRVPEPIWLDLSRFSHWIEDSVVVRWAELTAAFTRDGTVGTYLPYVAPLLQDTRETQEVRQVLTKRGGSVHCVWTGRALDAGFHIDHAIPYTVWGNNDLWNLLPCAPAVNVRKSDSLPSLALLERRAGAIADAWQVYSDVFPERFAFQIGRSLGGAPSEHGWQGVALAGLRETVQRLAAARGLRQWEP